MNAPWTHVVVRELRPGAEYAGTTYDQDIVVEASAGQLCLFDMTPMIGATLTPGQSLYVVIGLTAPSGLHRQAGAICTLESRSWQPEQSEQVGGTARAELRTRQWALLVLPTASYLVAQSEVAAAGLAEGDPVAWENGRLDLLAWRS